MTVTSEKQPRKRRTKSELQAERGKALAAEVSDLSLRNLREFAKVLDTETAVYLVNQLNDSLPKD